MPKIVAVIPARSGSKGVPDKNIKLLSGRPLIAYSIIAAKQSNLIDEVFVSTDSTNYAEIARHYGAETPFIRPPEISNDSAKDIDVMLHFLQWYEGEHDSQCDFIVFLRPTTPLRDPTVVDQAMEFLLQNKSRSTALRSIHEMPETAYKCLEKEGAYLKTIFEGSFDIESANKPRQSFPKTYQANGYVDILKADFVIKNKKCFGDKVLAFETPVALEVDSLDDFTRLEFYANKSNLLFD